MDIEKELVSIEAELKAFGHREIPEQKLRDLIRRMNRQDLKDWRPNLAQVIDLHFMPKRRRALLDFIDDEIAGRPTDARERSFRATRPSTQQGRIIRPAAVSINDQFQRELRELSEKHIFQWATRYQDCLSRYFDFYIERLESLSTPNDGPPLLKHLAEHSCDIFTKGYNYSVHTQYLSHSGAVEKSITGLGRFLDLPLSYYSTRASRSYDQRSILALRQVFSNSVVGILSGFATVQIGEMSGTAALAVFHEKWADILAFLTPSAARTTANLIPSGPFRDGIIRSVLPLLDSVGHLLNKKREDYFPIPLLSHFSSDNRCLEISVRAPPSSSSRFIEVQAHLDDAHVSRHTIDRAYRQRMSLVVAPLKPDVREQVRSSPVLRKIVVDTHDSSQAIVEHAIQIWEEKIFSLRSKRRGPALTYNIARDFPLLEPSSKIPRFYRVHRMSVRELLGTIGKRNGVRLWCSIRRSGKTTSCLDFDTNSGDAVIISQTCGTAPSNDARLFYQRVSEALALGTQLDPTFVETTVMECARETVDKSTRKILIIDEYETLFGRLRATANQNKLVRYTVVQPLLDQFVEFAHNDQLIFMGQQPDAHLILMDQNQLAPCVVQDPFPLFTHVPGKKSGEFAALVRKIFSDQIEYDTGFLDALYDETSGHPFLTANTLCVMGDWLIEERRSGDRLVLQRGDFESFRDTQLRPRKMMQSPDYSFFRGAASEALGRLGYESNNWLFAVYWVVRELCKTGGTQMMVSREEMPRIMKNIPAPGPLPEADEILRTASQANFLNYTDDRVWVKIRTLGRLAAVVRPALG